MAHLIRNTRKAIFDAHFDVGAMNRTNQTQPNALTAADILVFSCLELLGVAALVGNGALITVIVRCKYLSKASFILICSLAIADVLHALVTTGYFYPPIVLKENHMPPLGCRLMIMIDWTAWGITISHMSAVCIDRLIAILLFAKYMQIMTPRRVKTFSLSLWVFLGSMNAFFFLADFCCVIVPQESSDYYSFDFARPKFENGTEQMEFFNVYPPIYTPLEVLAMLILVVSNPITLVNLWRRHQRKMALRRASALLLEMSQTMTHDDSTKPQKKFDQAMDAAHAATSAAAKQQQRIFIQIITVTLIFFIYMFVYYLFFYVVHVTDKWAVVFNSFFYSSTHILNPIVYFGLNQEMRMQLLSLLGIRVARRPYVDKRVRRVMKNMAPPSQASVNEMSPLLKRHENHLARENANSLSAVSSIERPTVNSTCFESNSVVVANSAAEEKPLLDKTNERRPTATSKNSVQIFIVTDPTGEEPVYL